ncbi:SusC/RagA family TonB-linked outer membrane protein [Arcticibacter sp. MXS-1]|uniref:SusC/RagA family TonB-linked outer membrane protein n=1 Tax=Arcticibacter sp. MXS-1 TaxID=3341726 RepID=UPI0035A992B6
MIRFFTKREKRLCRLLSLLVVFLIALNVSGQTRQVRGRVTDTKGEPLPGVSVQIKGVKGGTTTAGNGRFQLNVAEGASLVFTFIGFQSKEVKAGSGQELNVVLQETSSQLNEVVVVGYGTQKKVNLTGSVSVVDGEEMAKRPVASTSMALQGIAPGVTVTQGSGLPGADQGTLRIRGVGSFMAGQDPLVLIDNIEMSLDAIDPNNIESISVLKDAAAAAVYGSRAANGVVLITTKRGKKDATRVEYRAYGGWQEATNFPEKVSAVEHMQYMNTARQNIGQSAGFSEELINDYITNGVDNFARLNTDWIGEVLTNDGMMQSHNLSVSSGTEKIRMYASGSFLDQNGLTENTKMKRYDLRFNTDVSLARNLQASLDLTLNKQDRHWPGGASPNFIISQAIGLPANQPGIFHSGEYGEGWANRNPIALARSSGFNTRVTNSRVIAGSLKYTPVEGLELFTTYNSNSYSVRSRNLIKQYQVYSADLVNNALVPSVLYPATNSLNDGILDNSRDMFRAQATYKKSVSKHNFTFLGGFSTESFKSSGIDGSVVISLDPDKPYLSAGDDVGVGVGSDELRFKMVSFYGRFNYNYNEKYLFEANGRWDASSRFLSRNRWDVFPSVSAGWRLSQEDFWERIKPAVNEAKLRLSYGSLGNQNLMDANGTPVFYPAYASYNTDKPYYFNNVANTGYALTDASYEDIRWETSTQFDLGLDLAFLKNRLSVTADFYRRDIKKMLQLLPIPNYVGLGAPYINAGSMRNTGWELAAGWKDNLKDFKYQVQLTLSDVKNKALDLSGQEYINGLLISKEGYAINSYYGYVADGLYQNAEEIAAGPNRWRSVTAPGDIRYKDISGANGVPDGVIDSYDRAILGNSFPRYEYSANFSAQWKGFDFTAFFQGLEKRITICRVRVLRLFSPASFRGRCSIT